ncbi:MAG TPA: histidine phosphatase family protein, partial [Caldilineaceae bacterium]|nr:histidine phosphatase family protein [Caldilineaceae bacterium]
MHVFIVRHGECLGNVDATLHPGPDTTLTPLGRTQARCAAKRLAGLGITHVVSSPLLRALSTAQTIAEEATITQITVCMDLREGNHGEYWCEPRSRLAAAAPTAILPAELGESGWLHKTADNGEFTLRCEHVIRWVKATFTH